jgi:alkylated DNA nucleotide flippase Atl1
MSQGEELRDQGTHRVLWAPSQDEWRELAYSWLWALPSGWRVTSTDMVTAIGMPPSPNAVGAIMRSAAVRGYLTATDEYVRSTRPSCHAAVVRVWVAT